MFRYLLLIILLTGSLISEEQVKAPVEVTLVHEAVSVQPGESLWVGIAFSIDRNWHIYWKNPGGTGVPPKIEWSLPQGFTVTDLEWPTPERLDTFEGTGYGYHDQVTLLAKLTAPAHFKGDHVDIGATVTWIVCSDEACLPGEKTLHATLPITLVEGAAHPQFHEAIQSVIKTLPQEKEVSWSQGNTGSLTIPSHHAESIVYFYPEEQHTISDQGPLSGENNERMIASLSPLDRPVKGLLVFQNASGEKEAWNIELPYTSQGFEGGVLWALVLAFIGGMILNLMPCVLPVVSLKIFSFVKMGGEKKGEILKQGLFFTAGVLVSFWALAGTLILLRSWGELVGWGFQLQDPLFVAILIALIFGFGLSLFGVFEIGTMFSSWAGQTEAEKRKSGGTASFFSGVLATAVATPCTGPFLGSAVGFAMTLSPIGALAIFTSLGLGMASPYLVISCYPPLFRFFPKPGNWMLVFKEIMGFCMMATVLWLLWVFGAETSLVSTMILLVSLFVLSIAGWVHGQWGTPIRSRRTRMISMIVTFALLVQSAYILVSATKMTPMIEEIAMADTFSSKERDIRQWETFSKERLAALRASGTPVLVDFTARWCLICQANHMVLSTKEVSDRLAELGVVKMLADWTKNDSAITEELKKHGRSSVPLYLLYERGDKVSPEILPQVLTPDGMVEALKKIKEAPVYEAR